MLTAHWCAILRWSTAKCRSELSLLSPYSVRFSFFFCWRKSISFLVESSDPSMDENPFSSNFLGKPPEKPKNPEKRKRLSLTSTSLTSLTLFGGKRENSNQVHCGSLLAPFWPHMHDRPLRVCASAWPTSGNRRRSTIRRSVIYSYLLIFYQVPNYNISYTELKKIQKQSGLHCRLLFFSELNPEIYVHM